MDDAPSYSYLGKPLDDVLYDGFPNSKSDRNWQFAEIQRNFTPFVGSKIVLKNSFNNTDRLTTLLKSSFRYDVISNVNLKANVAVSTHPSSPLVNAGFGFRRKNGESSQIVHVKGSNHLITLGGGHQSPATNFNFLSEHSLLPSLQTSLLQVAGVFVFGNYAIGTQICQGGPSNRSKDSIEGKLSVLSPSKDSRVVLKVRQAEGEPSFSLGFLFEPVYSKALAAKVIFSPGVATFVDNVEVELAAANQVSASTLVKARYLSAPNTIGFGFAHLLSRNVLIEFGADIPLHSKEGAKFSLALVCS